MAKDRDRKPGNDGHKGADSALGKAAADAANAAVKVAKAAVATARKATAGEHHPASAHGRPVKVDTSLPKTRQALLALHAEARARRNGAALGSPEFRAAVLDLERIEVRIAAIDRAAEPPLG